MEADTIDLTDPLEEIFKKTNWTPECLNERLSLLAERNVNNRKNKEGIITLNDLLGDYTVAGSAAPAVSQSFETIELSDDETSDVVEVAGSEGYNNETVNEVQVIEVSDFSDENSCNSDQNEDVDHYEEFTYENSNLNDTSVEVNDNNSEQEVLVSTDVADVISLEACKKGDFENDELQAVHVEVLKIAEVVSELGTEQELDNSNPQQQNSDTVISCCDDRPCTENVVSENDKEKSFESSKSEVSKATDSIKNLENDTMEGAIEGNTNFGTSIPQMICDNDKRQHFLETLGSEVERVTNDVVKGRVNVDLDKIEPSDSSRNQGKILAAISYRETEPSFCTSSQIPSDHVSYIKKVIDNKSFSLENGRSEVSKTTDRDDNFFQTSSDLSAQENNSLKTSTGSQKKAEILNESDTRKGIIEPMRSEVIAKEAENRSEEKSYTDTEKFDSDRSCCLSNTDSFNKNNSNDHDYGGNSGARIVASPSTEEHLKSPDKSSLSHTNMLAEKDQSTVKTNQTKHEEQNRIDAPSNESFQTSSHSFDHVPEDNRIDSNNIVSGNISDLQESSLNETKLVKLESENNRREKQSTGSILLGESNLDQSGLHQTVALSSKEEVENVEESACDVQTNFDKLEDIRRHLKLQLTSLRTKKKLDILQEVKQTIANIDDVKETGSLSNVSDESNSLSTAEDSVEKSGSKVSTFRRIFEADNGCDNAVIDKTDHSLDSQEDENVPNVFNEIRKIIRKSKSSSSTLLAKTNNNSSSFSNTSSILPYNEESMTKKINLEEKPASITRKTENSDLTSNNTVSSPFVSNSLDEFLNDSKLNVSYSIPKCDAEEGLKQDYSVDPVVPYDTKIKGDSEEKLKKETKVKAKTLAEKRRLLEKKRKLEQKRLKKSLIREELQKRSFVLFKNKKVFVQSRSLGKCFACIESEASNVKAEFPAPVLKKPSLLKELYRKTCPVKYRPGPLSKKYLLQSDYSHWATELKPLPRVILDVMPEFGKPVHKNLLPIVSQWNCEITDTQVEFALSALATKSAHNRQIFQFHVNYEKGQEKLLVRRKTSNVNKIKLENVTAVKSSDPEADIAEVMENLIKYVEIKELAPSLIKDDNLHDLTDNHTPLEPSVINQNRKRKPSKFSRTSKELLRLSCKVVSMEVQESGQETHCSKSFCKFGCVCDSLKCKAMIGLHCQKSTCIFGCSCPKEPGKLINVAEPFVSVNSSTEFLSTDTVTRIEGEAKKNLARVEKEFTQTVIYTNDKTIVVSTGNKIRRAARAPKKYSDFFDEDIFKEIAPEIKKERKPLVKPCTVALEKWDFNDIVPYCLVHYLYNCHCKGLSSFSSLKTGKNCNIGKDNQLNQPAKQNYKIKTDESTKLKRKLSNETIGSDISSSETVSFVSIRPIRKKKPPCNSDFIPYEDIMTLVSHERVNTSDYSAVRSPVFSQSFYCSRTSEIPERYRSVKTFTNAATYLDFASNISEADLLKLKLMKKEDMSESDKFKAEVIKEKRRQLKTTTIDSIEHRKTHQRKQQIEVRQDEDLNIKASRAVTQASVKGKISSVFSGEIIVNDSDWLRKLCINSKQPLSGGYARILPWNALLKGFLSKSINVYCICDTPLRLLLNVGQKIVRDKVVDIEMFGHKILEKPLNGQAPWLISQSESVRDIIKWLLSGTLPSKYKATSLSFLLVETLPGQFEVRGLCTQSENTGNKSNSGDGRTNSEICDDITEIKHKNMNHEVQSLFITKAKYRMRELVEDGFDDDLTDNLYMWAGLPEVYKVAKWRVIFLKNDFAYLHIKNIKYTIKYTDLVKLTEMAVEEQVTLLVRNLQIRRSYEHFSFGIYVTPTYQDRIFIGPYFISHEEEDIETLRYMNQFLVSSESLNRMKGYADYKCGHWMYERPHYHKPKKVLKETIDLTSDESPTAPVCRIEKKLLSSPPQVADEQTINYNGVNVQIKNSRPRAPSEFNRYIITNIPHFGYLGAYQPDNSPILEVSWPFEKKVLQFENADHARDFLQERFNQLLQPVPETFKIQVIVLIHLDLKEHQPINSDFLSGQCICGYFGTYNFRELTDDFCKQELKTTKDEITKLFAKRAQDYIRKRVTELAELAGINAIDKANYNIETILNKAKEEVKLLEQLRIQYIAEIQAMENVVIANVKKLFGMVSRLPIKERNIESKILNEIMQIRPKRIGANEVIEINDDDRTTSTNNEIFEKVYVDQDNNESVLKGSKRKIGSTENISMPKIARAESLHSTSVTEGEQCNTDQLEGVTEKSPTSLTR